MYENKVYESIYDSRHIQKFDIKSISSAQELINGHHINRTSTEWVYWSSH